MRLTALASLALVVLTCVSARAQAPASPAPSAADVARRVDALVGQMTLEDKIDLLGGVDGFFIRDLPRLGWPRLKMADGPIGVRNFGPATAMAAGISLSASWNQQLAERVGAEIGRDARAKGVHFLLGPGVNIYRAPMNGRNFEYFGEDPFLASRITVGYIKGVQAQGVSATVKHFLGNNSEFDRHNTDTVVDERTLREIYLPVFEAAVKEARVGAIMDSYNLTNGQHMTQNGYLNTDVAKKEWGFSGIMMSDWDATYDAVAAANGGLDLEMPAAKFMNREKLLPAVKEGKVSVATIDDKVRRILRTAIEFGWLDRDQTDLAIPRFSQQGREVALESAREGVVLLKNDGNLLPLGRNKVKTIAVIGPSAYPAVPVGGGSARVEPFVAVSLLEGLSRAAGATVAVTYDRGLPTLNDLARATDFSTAEVGGEPGLQVEVFGNTDLSGAPVSTRVDRRINFLAPFSGGDFEPGARPTPQPISMRWTGIFTPQKAGVHEIFVQGTGEDGGYRLFVDGTAAIDCWRGANARVGQATLDLSAGPHKVVLEQFRRRSFGTTPRIRLGIARQDSLVAPAAKALAARADAVILAVGFEPETESEGSDRTFGLPPGQEQLIRELAGANKNAVVVLTAGGGVDMNAWIERVPALLQAWYPGQEGGTALAEILLGDVNPSGRLPVTFERRFEDNPAHASYYAQGDTRRVQYSEGVFVGYRGYERNKTKPLFPFGFGLSYTTFAYANLEVAPARSKDGNVRVSFDVTNTGARAGAEVAQVYVGDAHAKVPRPPKELKGFVKVGLKPGETRRVTVTLDQRAFAYFDAQAKRWRVDPGDFDVLVGRSVEQVELRGKVGVTPAR